MKHFFLFAVLFWVNPWLVAQSGITFSGTELLGRPTDHSITVNVLADTALDVYFEYGIASGIYTNQTDSLF